MIGGHSGRQPPPYPPAKAGEAPSPALKTPPAPAVAPRGRWALELDCEDLRTGQRELPADLVARVLDWQQRLPALGGPGTWVIMTIWWEGESCRLAGRNDITLQWYRAPATPPPPAELMRYAERVAL